MPSPFPGMDPWLENRRIWPDLHDGLASEIRAALNGILPPTYYAQLGVREELGIVGKLISRRIIPDVAIQRNPQNEATVSSQTAVLAMPRADIAESVEFNIFQEPREVNFVEICDACSPHEVVTLIEILSPANKDKSADQEMYVKKREEILHSNTSLIEIDLLRQGDRTIYGMDVYEKLAEFDPPIDYFALVQRAWKRSPSYHYQLFPARITATLPVIAVPLRKEDIEVTLDLQYVFQQAYDRGPYRRGAVDYTQPAVPELPTEYQAWTETRLRNWSKN